MAANNQTTKRSEKQAEDNLGQIEGALSKSELFLENNKKTISIVLGIIIVIVLGIFAYRRLYVQPREEKAQLEIYKAQKDFDNGNFLKALNGDTVSSLGFLGIQDNFKGTKSAKISNYYIGICNLQLGNYQEAIDYLKKFKMKDYFVYGLSRAAIGDAYIELGDMKSAISYYKEACNYNTNEVLTPEMLKKLATAYELNGDIDKAIESYNKIVDDYPSSVQKNDAKKNIGRLQAGKLQ